MPDQSIQIRPAIPTDFDQLCMLWEVLDEHHRQVRPDMFREPVGARRDPDWVNNIINDADSDILVAETPDKSLVGMVLLIVRQPPDLPIRISQPFVEIDNIVVSPSQQHLGVGSRLVAASKTWATARGHLQLQLTVYAFNSSAIRFYDTEGFEPLSHRLALRL